MVFLLYVGEAYPAREGARQHECHQLCFVVAFGVLVGVPVAGRAIEFGAVILGAFLFFLALAKLTTLVALSRRTGWGYEWLLRLHLFSILFGFVVRDVMQITFGLVVAGVLITNPHAFR